MRRRDFLLTVAAFAAPAAAGLAATGPLILSGPEFDAALRAAANRARTENGLAAFAAQERLTAAALAQAQIMAEARRMEHEIPGRPDFAMRLRAARVRPRRAAENILRSNLSRHGARCAQATTAFMSELTEELAADSLRRWMGSPPHRANLLEPRYRRIGGAYAVVAAPDACGQIYIAQVLAN